VRILGIGDPHIRPNAEFSRPLPQGLTTHLLRLRDSLRWVTESVRSLRPDVVVCLGDVFDSPDAVDTRASKVASEEFSYIASACASVGAAFHILVGNHDLYSDECHTLSGLGLIPGVTVWSQPGVSSEGILMMPFTEDLADPSLYPLDPVAVCSHQPLLGCPLYGAMLERNGLDPVVWDAPVIQGHYHLPHHDRNVWCPGSLMAKSFHDRPGDVGRGLVLVDTANLASATFYDNPHSLIYRDVVLPGDLDDALGWDDPERTAVRVFYHPDDRDLAETVATTFAQARLVPQKASVQLEARTDDLEAGSHPAENLTEWVQLTVDDPGDLLDVGLSLLPTDTIRRGGSAKVKSVTLSDFYSWGDVTVEMPESGIVLVDGKNGHGKSYLLVDALLWCLHGKTSRPGETANSVRRLLNPMVDDDARADTCSVRLELTTQGRDLIIERTRDPGPRLDMTINRVEGSARLQAVAQAEVDMELGCSRSGLLTTTFMIAGMSSAFTTLNATQRLGLLEEVLDLGVYAQARKEAVSRLAEARSMWVTSDAVLNEQAQARVGVQDTVKRYEANLAGHLDARPPDPTPPASLDEFQREVEKMRQVIDFRTQAVDHGLSGHRTSAERLTQAKAREAGLDAELRSSTHKVQHLEALLSGGQCPNCGSSDAATWSDQLINAHDIQSAGQDAVTNAKQVTRLRSVSVVEAEQAHQAAGRRLTHARIAWEQANSRLASLRTEQATAQGVVAAWEATGTQIRASLVSSRESLRLLDARTTETQAKTEELLADVTTLSWWVDALSPKGLRAHLLTEALGMLNDRLAVYMSSLAPWGVAVVLEKDVPVIKLTGTARAVSSLSRGQRRLVDWALQLSLGDLARDRGMGHLNLLVCDEVIDALDPDALAAVVDLLEEIATTRPVMLVAHNPSLQALVPSRWQVAMDVDGLSHLEC
jgi:hypothetical protein